MARAGYDDEEFPNWWYSTVRDTHAFKVTENSEKLYYDLIELGFDDTEFPDWWYSPARAVEKEQAAAVAAVPSSDVLLCQVLTSCLKFRKLC